jgi:MOSC domain-containing protein YiiM
MSTIGVEDMVASTTTLTAEPFRQHAGAVEHVTTEALLAGLDQVRSAPADGGRLELIVRRPVTEEREELTQAELRTDVGLDGDNWAERGSRHTPDGSAERSRQLTLMNARAIALFAGDRSRWGLAGDQLYVDLDLSDDNLPPGSKLRIGGAVIEVSSAPHTGCAKFRKRFGADVSRFVNSSEGVQLHLRGVNAYVVEPGAIRAGDLVTKVAAERPAATALAHDTSASSPGAAT